MSTLQSQWLFGGVLLCTALLTPCLSGQQLQGKKYALLVGVNNYRHINLGPLRFAENDVVALARLLEAGGYELVLLTTGAGKQQAERAPTLANIQHHLDRLRQLCQQQDTLLVALAGHGVHFERHNDSFFCPSDGNPNESEVKTLLSLRETYRKLGVCGAGIKLLLVDACRNNPRLVRSFDATGVSPPGGVAALFSCKKGEVAFEHEALQHGIFFHHVLEGLRGRAAAANGQVSWDGLVAHVRQQVPTTVKEKLGADARQTPTHSAVEFEGAVLLTARDRLALPVGEPIVTNSIGMKLVRVTAGKFLMGSSAEERERREDEKQHEVEITRDFYIGMYEVTQEEFEKVMGHNPSHFSMHGAGKEAVKGMDTHRFPVEDVSWDMAVAFCRTLSTTAAEKTRTGLVYTLPTEAEWEYACRGGPATSSAPFHFRKPSFSLSANQANFHAEGPYNGGTPGKPLERPCAAGRYEPNRLGLQDLHGNVREWCLDWYDARSHHQGSRRDPAGPAQGKYRVLRGGSWFDVGADCRAAFRLRDLLPTARYNDLGFRVVAHPAVTPAPSSK